MAVRVYYDQKTGKMIHAKPSDSQPGIIVYQADKKGRPGGRVHAATLEEFNSRFQIGAPVRGQEGAH